MCSILCEYFYELCLITSKNSQRYYTTERLIRDLLSNTPNSYVLAGVFRAYLFTGNARQKYAKRNGTGAGKSAN